MCDEKLKKQLEFILEVDKLKQIFRQTFISDSSRKENDSEHSWHLALMAVLLKEYSNEPVDILKVIKMVLIHDIVEIDAGDTYCYDDKGAMDKIEREQKAADRIFGMLPEEQCNEFKALWKEFDEMSTPEAKFAAALDRLQPLLLNYKTKGISWREHDITSERVFGRNRHIENGSKKLWDWTVEILNDCIDKGYLKE